jgi:anaerobic magnesium-protoporphyrin IX monomethyl ester cyclase
MKVALVFPRLAYPSGDVPLGLCYLASSILKHTKADVEILDTTFINEEPLEYLEKKFKENQYEYAGFSVMTTTLKDSNKVAQMIKKVSPKTKVIYGGPQPTIMPEKIIKIPEVDAVALREGEETFVEITKNKGNFKDVKGIWYKNEQGNIIKNPERPPVEDVDSLPFPARHLVDMKQYIKNWFQMDAVATNLRGTSLLASRGCPYRCSYCQPILDEMFGKGMRKRSAKNIVAEMKELKEKYNINAFDYADDTFTIHPEWVHEVCDEMIKENLNLSWMCNTRAHLVSEELFAKMKKAGLKQVYIGMESGSQRILDEVYQKDIKIEHVNKAVKILNDLDIKIHGYFIVGAPTETEEEIKQTIKFAKNLDITTATFSIATPLPLTHLYNKTKHMIDADIEDMDYYKNPVYRAGATMLSPDKIKYWKKRAFLEFYLHPKRIPATIKQLLSVKKAYNKLKRF